MYISSFGGAGGLAGLARGSPSNLGFCIIAMRAPQCFYIFGSPLLVISLAVALLVASMMGRISCLAVSAAILIKASWSQTEPEIPHTEWPQAIRMLGNLSSQVGISESKQDLFGRQACSQGYGHCSMIALTSVP